MKWQLPRNSLFMILARSPWWISALIAVGSFAALRLLIPQGMALFVGHFSYMMTAVLVMAAPAMVLLLIVDLSFGLVNRYAPQLNVFALTLPIKAWIATGVILLLLGVYAEILLDRLDTNRGLLQLMQKAFS